MWATLRRTDWLNVARGPVFLGSNILHSVYAASALSRAGLLSRFCGPVILSSDRWSGALPRAARESRLFPISKGLPLERLWWPEVAAKGSRLLHLDRERQAEIGRLALDASLTRKVSDESVVHLNSAGLFATAQKAKRNGAFLICDVREPHPATTAGVDPIGPQLEQEFASADVVLVNSEFTRSSFLQMGFEPDRLEVVPLGVDLDDFKPGPPKETGHGLRLLFAGAISHRKGLDVLLAALSKVDVPWELRVAGPIVDASIADRARATGGCELLGPLTRLQLRREYQAADLFVLPSRSDSYPLVSLEAIACGTPVLLTDQCGTAPLILELEAGVVVGADDPNALAAALAALADDRVRLDRLTAACLPARQAMTWESYGDALVELYRRRVLPWVE
jgi:glycosyltransferase involved in cell wall biosynthesis